ncbi:MAG: class I poly(R)-hydroxyalkanoic acid synthase [Pseudomonadota bacterium]
MSDRADPTLDTEALLADFDPEVFAKNLARAVDDGTKLVGSIAERSQDVPGQVQQSEDLGHVASLFVEVLQSWMERPDTFAEAQGALMRDYADLFAHMSARLTGQNVEPVVEAAPGDRRFKDEEWSSNPYFDFWKQAFLIGEKWAQSLVADSAGLDDHTRHKAAFYLRVLSGALSPSNFPVTNPEVVRETLRTSGENLIDGVHQLADDLARSEDVLKITQTDRAAFVVGRDLAVSPGKVVYRNEIFELIQYAPTTDVVHARPFLLVPPWINKFYVLDLTPEKSFIRYIVAQGFTVFVVSWVNPDARLAEVTFADYMKRGMLEAASVASEICDGKKANVLGYCVGGTLVGTTIAWLAAGKRKRKNRPFSSATLLTTQLDFTRAGDLQVFVDDEQIAAVEEMMAQTGYLDGAKMAGAFNMLRPGDLIYPYVVNNYLLGKKPMKFDLLFWNQDSTRMPAANHAFYLREFYQHNRLAKGEMTIAGRRLDLGAVDIPIYELATREDHIAPPGSVYTGAKLIGDGAHVRFVLAGSGHIAGVVNPPEKNKYQYWTNAAGMAPDTLDDWLAGAEETAGSWWPDWITWLRQVSGKMVAARTPGEGPYEALEDAPGSYVRIPS